MLRINTVQKHAPMQQVARRFKTGNLFRDRDGDLHLRLMVGCVRFDGDNMYQYSESDLDACAFFDRCTPVLGDVTININLR